MASNYGVIAFISPPRLKSVTQPALIKFETEYAAYKEKCADVNRSRDDADKIPVATIRDCVESSTLQALCLMGDIIGANTVEEVTPEMVQVWFASTLAEAPRDLSERIRSALSTVQYKQCKEDPAGAVVMFVIDVIKSLDQNNASEILTDVDKAKFLIDRMEEKLEPALLRERIRMKRTLWSKAEKGDIKLFRREASTLAVDVSQNEVARSRISFPGKRSRSDRLERGGTAERRVRQKRPDDIPEKAAEGSKTTGSFNRSSRKVLPPKGVTCLNTECSGKHFVKDCPQTSPEQRQKLLEEYFRTKKAAKAVMVREKEDTESILGGRYEVAIEDTVRSIALGDSGADCSAISQAVFEELLKEVPALSSAVAHFDNPLPLEGAFGLGAQCTASKSIVSSITLFLPGSNIPVRLRGVKFVVVDGEMNEVLLGRPLLNAIGFNLDRHLETVRPHVHNKNILEIDPDSVKLAKAQYTGMSYQMVDDDPIPLPETIAAGIGMD